MPEISVRAVGQLTSFPRFLGQTFELLSNGDLSDVRKLVLAALAAITLAACGSSAEQSPESRAGGQRRPEVGGPFE